MPQEPEIIEYFDGPVAALVIGISEYLHGVTPEKNKAVSLEEDEFPNLQYAHKDAEKFAAFLQKKGVSELTLLTNKEATRPNIITGFKKLRTYCAELKKHYENSDGKMKPPLIVVFFSGHGWADPSNEHYLVPYEAERNRLEETALSNKDLKTNLEKLDTEKLVVFLDACHSGALANVNVKGGASTYDFKKDLENLGDGAGQYVISSCKPKQKSFELDKFESGIFTHHLLDLLECEKKEVWEEFSEEQIDIFTLYNSLEKKVRETSKNECREEQEPDINTKGGSRFIIAINKPRILLRIEKENEERKNKEEFLEQLCIAIEDSAACEFPVKVKYDLRSHVNNPSKDKPELKNFYKCFDEHYILWIDTDKPKELPQDECCPILIDLYDQYIQDRKMAANERKKVAAVEKPPETLPENIAASKAQNDSTQKPDETEASPVIVNTEKQPTLLTQPNPVASEERLDLSSQVVPILQPLKEGGYDEETGKLFKCLNKSISENEFQTCINDLKKEKSADEELHKILDAVMEQFNGQWKQLIRKPVDAFTNIASLRSETRPS